MKEGLTFRKKVQPEKTRRFTLKVGLIWKEKVYPKSRFNLKGEGLP